VGGPRARRAVRLHPQRRSGRRHHARRVDLVRAVAGRRAVLDSDWSGWITASYVSDGTTATVTVSGADFEPVVTATGYAPQAGTFSDYVFQIDVATGDFTGSFTGTVTLDGRDVDWDNSVDSTLIGGYQTPSKTVNQTNVEYWKWCGAPGAGCVAVAGAVGTNNWTLLNDKGKWKTVNTFSPYGDMVMGEIPEPETFVMMGTGLVGLAVFARKRRRPNTRPNPAPNPSSPS
jgi:hypothetical protein